MHACARARACALNAACIVRQSHARVSETVTEDLGDGFACEFSLRIRAEEPSTTDSVMAMTTLKCIKQKPVGTEQLLGAAARSWETQERWKGCRPYRSRTGAASAQTAFANCIYGLGFEPPDTVVIV